MFKKYLIPLSTCALLLSGCSGLSGQEEVPAGKQIVETAAFQLFAPEAWEVIDNQSFTETVPQNTVIAIRNNVKNEIFTANLNINQTVLTKEISATDFAKSTGARNKTSLVDYQAISSSSNEVGVISKFKGRRSAADAETTFTQLYVIDDTTAYTVTAAALSTEEESVVKMLDEMIDSFSLK